MSLPQHITRGVGGTVYLDRTTRPDLDEGDSILVDVLTDTGAVLVSGGTATISDVATALAEAAARGDSSVEVDDIDGVASGSVLWLQDDPEPVLVQRVVAAESGDGGTVHLRRPLLKAHNDDAVCEGARCSLTITAEQAATRFWDGRCKWTFPDGAVEYTELECTEYPFTRHATLQDLWDANPALSEVLLPTVDTERLLDAGRDEVLQRIGAKGRARCFTGSSGFRRANAIAAWMLHYEHVPSDEGTLLFDRYTKLLEQELQRVIETTPRDENQDGVISDRDKLSYRSIRLRY